MNKNKTYLKYFLWLIIISSSLVLIFTSYKLYKRDMDSKRIDSISIRTEIENENKDTLEDKDPLYYTPIENEEKKWIDINQDYQGWLEIENTNISYPVVRGIDNYYYLDKDFSRKESELGAIFMDYRNLGNYNDKHTVIYGHYTWTGKMFADLHNYKDETFAKENNLIGFKGLYNKKDFEIFSVYIDSASDYELKLNFEEDKDYKDYLVKLEELSLHEFNVNLDPSKLLLTLATCSYEVGNGRLIVHAIEK